MKTANVEQKSMQEKSITTRTVDFGLEGLI